MKQLCNHITLALATCLLLLLPLCTPYAQEKFLPFLDDFSSYTGLPDCNLWQGDNCFVNTSYQYLPPTVGVVTLDAIDRNGVLYPSANSLGFIGDTLCSVSIRLDSLRYPIPKQLQPSDSLYLSFFVQPGGGMGPVWERIGHQPSEKDSLVLQFFSASENEWNSVWSIKGTSVDSLFASCGNYFKFVQIAIDDPKYFNPFFRFRFLNYASLDANPDDNYVINCDQWNLDYVYLNHNRTIADTVFKDIAFSQPAQSLLKDYVSVPYRQYRPDMMKQNLDIKISNLYSDPLSSIYKYYVKDELGNTIASYDGGFENISPFLLTHSFQTSPNHAAPPVNFAYPTLYNEQSFDVVHVVHEGVGQDNLQSNDTIRFKQIFEDYYAYDDGTAEAGYGINPLKGSNIALCFSVNQTDTLSAIDIYFNKTNNRDTTERKYFYLCVWDADNGSEHLPDNLLFKSERVLPATDSLNKFTRYILPQSVILHPGLFYVSLEIKNKGDYINIGFDRNNDASAFTFSKVSDVTGWQQSFQHGALMIRPYFGRKASVSLSEVTQRDDFKLYPNPASDFVFVSDRDKSTEKDFAIFDLLGNCLIRQSSDKVDVSSLPQGIYIVKSGNISKKLIIAR